MLTTSPTLLQKLRQSDDREAWGRFVSLYTPLLLVWARRQGLREPDAEDLVQEVLMKLVRTLPIFQRSEGRRFRGWLAEVTRNQCRDFRRRLATRLLPGSDGLSNAIVPYPESDKVSDLEEAEYQRQLVRRGLELIRPDFTEKTWAAFTGVVIETREVAPVASELGVTENAVHQARHRVLTRLRQELDGLLE